MDVTLSGGGANPAVPDESTKVVRERVGEHAQNSMTDSISSSEHAIVDRGSVNSADRSHQSPRSKNVREGDWICASCGASVFGRNISCFRCMAPKPGSNARHGDWICLNKQCGAHNYAGRSNCYKCFVPRGSEKPGDWPCPTCFSNNFASRLECFRCHAVRPQSYNMYIQLRPGDWICPNPMCGTSVFANRETCFRCNTQRPQDAEVATMYSNMRAGDWTCSVCYALCYGGTLTCYRCDNPRPSDSTSQGAIQSPMMSSGMMGSPGTAPPGFNQQAYAYAAYPMYNPYMTPGYYPQYYQNGSVMMNPPTLHMSGASYFKRRDGDWVCDKCSENNFAKRTLCFKCRLPRTERPVSASSGDETISSEPKHSSDFAAGNKGVSA